jgi:hypothetical protein
VLVKLAQTGRHPSFLKSNTSSSITTTPTQRCFSTRRDEFGRGMLKLPPDLVPYIRDCLWAGWTNHSNRHLMTDFGVAFLGTGSSAIFKNRAFAASVLRLERFVRQKLFQNELKNASCLICHFLLCLLCFEDLLV